MARPRRGRLRRQSLRRKLTLLIVVYTVANLALLAIGTYALDAMSTVRACVAAASQYSSAQKDAIYALARYAHGGDEAAYREFRGRLAVPLAAGEARRVLLGPDTDLDRAVDALIRAGIHPEDARAMRKVMVRFHDLPNVARAIDAWSAADEQLVELERLGEAFHGGGGASAGAASLTRVDAVGRALTARMDEFTLALGAAGRRLRWIMIVVMLVTTAGFLTLGLAIARALSRSVLGGIARLRVGTERVGGGDLSGRIGLAPDDEVGQLGVAFDAMTDRLDRAVRERRAAEDALRDQAAALAEANRSLRERQGQLAEAQAIAHVGSWELDLATGDVVVSDELMRIVGHPRGSPRMSPIEYLERVHPEDRDRVRRTVQATMAGGPAYSQDYRLIRDAGELRWIHGQGRHVPAEGGRGARYVGTLQDITERRVLEERLLATDRLAAVGTLAGGVAHEINNPLAYVAANLEYVVEELTRAAGDAPLPAEVDAALREAQLGAERIRRIVGDLKTFSRGAPDGEASAVDVARALEPAINMATPEIRQRAQLVREIAPVPPVLADEARLGQVVLNLLVNAAQAIAEGEVERNTIRVVARPFDPGRVAIEVHDTGAGIPPEIRRRIFDPFFTTKPVGTGTGLGLAICQGIVASFGGELTVDSVVGEGSVFRVLLPVATAALPRPADAAEAAPRRARILIIDDDPMVARGLRRTLGRSHDVVIARDGESGLAVLAADAAFDVILCDLMMPEMTGMTFHEILSARAPAQAERVVFVTGGAFTPGAREFVERTSRPTLDKPIDPAALAAILRQRA